MDFVWWRGSRAVAIEVKSSRRYRDQYRAGIRSFADGFKGSVASWIVYRGEEELEVDGTRVLPAAAFLERLHRGEVLG